MTTPEKQFLLHRLNTEADAAHQDAAKKAERAGKPHPPAPAPLTLESLEFPKWVHKGWKESGKAEGHHEAAESKLAHNEEELKALVAKGFSESPLKVEAKSPKKE